MQSSRPSRAKKAASEPPRVPRNSPLTKGDMDVLLCPREGLDITKVRHASLSDGVLRAIGLSYNKEAEDLIINPAKNIIVVSPPSGERASKSTAVKELHFGENS